MAHNFAEMLKAKKKEQEEKEYADVNQPRWNYLKNCNHDLHENQCCPMCLLVSASTKKFLIEEAKELAIARRVGTYHRAQIRYAMLDVWSRNQGTLAGDRYIGLSMDIHLNGPVLDALLYYSTSTDCVLPSVESIVMALERRKRIAKIGQYASTFLQCRIRKVTTKKRLRKYFLRRFDFYPMDKYIKYDYYIDKKTTRRWKHQPKILKGERPGSPRTIARRINTEEKKSLDRKRAFDKLMGTTFKLDRGDVWTLESENLVNMQRIILLKDVLSIAAALLHNRRFDFDEESAEHRMPAVRKKQKNGTAVGKSTILPSAVWVSLSAPAPPARALGLSIILNSLPAINDMTPDTAEVEEEARDLAKEAEEDEALRQNLVAEDSLSVASAGGMSRSKPGSSSGGSRGAFAAASSSSAFVSRPDSPSGSSIGGRLGTHNSRQLGRPDSSSRPLTSTNSMISIGADSVGGTSVGSASAGSGRIGTASVSDDSTGLAAGMSKVSSAACGDEPVVVHAGELTVNQRIILMEQLAWESLRCGSVDDVLTLLMCEELQAPFSSVMNIAEDDLGMWDSHMINKDSAAKLAEIEAEERAKEAAEAVEVELRKIELKKAEEEKRMEAKRKERRKRNAYGDDADDDSHSEDEDDKAEKAAQVAFAERKRAEAAQAAGMKVAAALVETVAPPPPLVLPSKLLIAKRLLGRVSLLERFKTQVKMNTTAGAAAEEKARLFAIKKRKEVLDLRREREERAFDPLAVAMREPTAAELAEEERWLAGEDKEEEEATVPVTDTLGHSRHDMLDVVPMTIHMRPCDVKKQNHECFRLFFLDFELIAICPWSPWAFHGEVLRSKDVIMQTLVTYAQRNYDLKKLMRQVTKKANEDSFHELSRNTTANPGQRAGTTTTTVTTGPPKPNGRAPGQGPGQGPGHGQRQSMGDDVGFCMDLYVPSERYMFPSTLCDFKIPTKSEAAEAAAAVKASAKAAADAIAAAKKTTKTTAPKIKTKTKTSEENVRLVALSPMTQQSPLSPTDAVALNDSYKFLSRLWEWKNALKYARSKLPKVDSTGPAVVSVKKQLADKKIAIAAAAEKKKAAEKAAADKKAGIVPSEGIKVATTEEVKVAVQKPSINEDELDEIAPDHEVARAFSTVARILKGNDELLSLLEGQTVFNAACLNLPGWVLDKDDKKESGGVAGVASVAAAFASISASNGKASSGDGKDNKTDKELQQAVAAAAVAVAAAHKVEPITADCLKSEDYIRNLKNLSTLTDTSMARRLSFNEGETVV